jgi:hypothetical protein
VRTTKGWSGCGGGAPGSGIQPAVDETAFGEAAGVAECTAPQAESDVMVLATTAKGCCGSRGSSRAGVNVDNGAIAPSGESNTGRFLGAQAANWVCGGAVFKGGASGLWKSEGRSIGAYSGPSSHVAMQFIVDAAEAAAVLAGKCSGLRLDSSTKYPVVNNWV